MQKITWAKWFNDVRKISGICDIDKYMKYCLEYYELGVSPKVAAGHLLESETRQQIMKTDHL